MENPTWRSEITMFLNNVGKNGIKRMEWVTFQEKCKKKKMTP
jgi:hypothetical protein